MIDVALAITAVALVTVGAGVLLTRRHRRLRSLRWTILAVAVAAVAAAAAVVGAAAALMILSPHDLRVVFAALAIGVGLGVVFALAVAGPLTNDLRSLAGTAGKIAHGDLSAQTGIVRADEVGMLARDVDAMVARLRQLRSEHDRDEDARRRLLASISHDLRTPLATIQASIEALQDGVAADVDRYLASMAGDVELLNGMVDDLFVIARLDAGDVRLDPMSIDLVELAEGAVETVASVAALRDVTVCVDADGPLHAMADPRAVTRVLRNLIDNAIRHAPWGSEVTVQLRNSDSRTVRVIDQGAGFGDGFVDQAFDRFSRADHARTRSGGSGLGLAIAQGLVEAHGGRIWIDPGPGGVVAFHLPPEH